MSRIDEALRRAAEESTGAIIADAEDVAPPPAAAGSDEISVLAGDLLSVPATAEMARVSAAKVAVATSPVVVTAPAPRTEPAPAPTIKGPSLFDRVDRRLAEKVVVDRKMDAASREQYRRLAAVLHDAQANGQTHVVMIASAIAGEGKTLTSTNLALTLSESYQRRVLLIDADLRKPALHQIFKVNTSSGLSEGLRQEGNAPLIVRQITPHLSLLPGGRPDSDPMAGLTSERMRRLIDEARETFDWVIIDTPPIVLLPDANLLASMADGAVLVVRAASTPHHLVKRAVETIGHKRILGVVLNQADLQQMPYGGYYQYYGDTPGGE